MNKILSIIKTILMIILLILTIKFITIYQEIGISLLAYLSTISIFIIINIKDYIKKNKIQENNTYNIISIIALSIIIFIFLRTLYDKTLIYNSETYISQIKEFYYSYTYPETEKIYNLLYLYQNIIYFIILCLLILIYRKINIEKIESKYHIITIICLIISICTIVTSLQYLDGSINNVIAYLIFNIILIAVEIYRLIKDNHKKHEWPIYVSWIFNTFALISIIVNIILK